jgi:hypothetical protein
MSPRASVGDFWIRAAVGRSCLDMRAVFPFSHFFRAADSYVETARHSFLRALIVRLNWKVLESGFDTLGGSDFSISSRLVDFSTLCGSA